MRIKSVGAWLFPTFGGCVGVTWIAVTILGIFGPTDPLLGDRFWNWVASMLIATPLAFLLAAALVAADIALVKWRRVPTGRHALVISGIAPLLVGTIYSLHRPGQYGNPVLFTLAIVLPLLIVAFGTRIVLGHKN
jgi:hypothetical protein